MYLRYLCPLISLKSPRLWPLTFHQVIGLWHKHLQSWLHRSRLYRKLWWHDLLTFVLWPLVLTGRPVSWAKSLFATVCYFGWMWRHESRRASRAACWSWKQDEFWFSKIYRFPFLATWGFLTRRTRWFIVQKLIVSRILSVCLSHLQNKRAERVLWEFVSSSRLWKTKQLSLGLGKSQCN